MQLITTVHLEFNRKNLENFLCNAELGRLWLIQIDDRIIGYIVFTFGFSFEYQGKYAFIHEFFIKEGFRKKVSVKERLNLYYPRQKKLDVKAIHLEVENHINAIDCIKEWDLMVLVGNCLLNVG